MSNIVKLKNSDTDKIILTRKALVGLRDYYPGFEEWYNSKIIPNIGKDRNIILATNNGEFSGALILKNNSEKKICTLFINPKNRHKNLSLDFLRIASEELQTYKMPISFNEKVKDYFFENNNFNFYTQDVIGKEYFGYIMYHNPDKELRCI